MAQEPLPGALLGELDALFARVGAIRADLLAELQEAEARSRRFTPEELQALATVQEALGRVARVQASANGNGAGSPDAFTALATLAGGGEQLIPQLQARLFAAGETSVGAPAASAASNPTAPSAPAPGETPAATATGAAAPTVPGAAPDNPTASPAQTTQTAAVPHVAAPG